VSAYLTEKLYIVKVHKPVRIVYHKCFSIRKIDKTAHLLFKTVNIMLDGFLGQHLTHIRSSGRVTDHTSTTAKKGNRAVACHLQSLHQAKSHEVSYMKAVCCRVKADIKCSFTIVYHLFDLVFICNLRDQATCFQFFPNCHCSFLLYSHIKNARFLSV
jgi:hypothetical protein